MVNNIFEYLIVRGGIVGNNNQLRLFRKIDFSMYPARAFAITLHEIKDNKGLDYLKNLGKLMGESAATAFKNAMDKMKSLIKKDYQTINNLIEISGFGKIGEFIEDDKKFIIRIKDHSVIAPSKKLYGNNSPVCSFYGEIFGAYIRVFKNLKKLKITHTKCGCNNNEFCEWVFEK